MRSGSRRLHGWRWRWSHSGIEGAWVPRGGGVNLTSEVIEPREGALYGSGPSDPRPVEDGHFQRGPDMTELSRSTAAQTDLRDVPPPRGFPRDELLRAGLMGNAIFSAGTGAAALLIPDGIAQLLGNLPPGWIQLLGASLIGFALVVGFVATRSPVPPVPAAVISLADVGWVVGSVLVIVFGAPVLGGAGVLVVGGVAVAVAGFASIQIAG